MCFLPVWRSLVNNTEGKGGLLCSQGLQAGREGARSRGRLTDSELSPLQERGELSLYGTLYVLMPIADDRELGRDAGLWLLW